MDSMSRSKPYPVDFRSQNLHVENILPHGEICEVKTSHMEHCSMSNTLHVERCSRSAPPVWISSRSPNRPRVELSEVHTLQVKNLSSLKPLKWRNVRGPQLHIQKFSRLTHPTVSKPKPATWRKFEVKTSEFGNFRRQSRVSGEMLEVNTFHM